MSKHQGNDRKSGEPLLKKGENYKELIQRVKEIDLASQAQDELNTRLQEDRFILKALKGNETSKIKDVELGQRDRFQPEAEQIKDLFYEKGLTLREAPTGSARDELISLLERYDKSPQEAKDKEFKTLKAQFQTKGFILQKATTDDDPYTLADLLLSAGFILQDEIPEGTSTPGPPTPGPRSLLTILQDIWTEYKKWILIGLITGVIILFIIVIAVSVPNGSSGTNDLCNKCDANDGFDLTQYKDTKGIEKKIKYKFVDDLVNDKYYNFKAGKQACKDLSAVSWEVLDGAEEWNAFLNISVEDHNQKNVWLNGEPNGKCDTRDCLDKAKRGDGIPINWPSGDRASNYSRLYVKSADEDCINVNTDMDDLPWTTSSCNATKWTFCVKRCC